MEKLKHLLTEWAALESDRCRHYKDEQSEDFDVLRTGTLHTIWAVNLGDISSSGLDSLQGAIQEAIACKSWLLSLENAADGKFYSSVRVPTLGHLRGDEHRCYGEADDAAQALLMAYLGCFKDDAAIGGES